MLGIGKIQFVKRLCCHLAGNSMPGVNNFDNSQGFINAGCTDCSDKKKLEKCLTPY